MSPLLNADTHWLPLPDAHSVALAVRDEILRTSRAAIRKNGVFRIVLAGGSTPEQIYTLLADEPCDWQHWQFYLGDERCLPANDSQRNSGMIERVLLSKITPPIENVHFIPAELGAKVAAEIYAKEIEPARPFDLVMLGMGEDGHTASLFPGQQHSPEELAHAVYAAPKPPAERVSLSTGSLSNNQQLIIIVTGESKKVALKQWQDGIDLPVARISSQGKTSIYFDASAKP